jgi:hypothetical protein
MQWWLWDRFAYLEFVLILDDFFLIFKNLALVSNIDFGDWSKEWSVVLLGLKRLLNDLGISHDLSKDVPAFLMHFIDLDFD